MSRLARPIPPDLRLWDERAEDPHWYMGYWLEPFFYRHFNTKSTRRIAKVAAVLVVTALRVSLLHYTD